MVEFKNIQKRYGDSVVVKNLNLQIEDGQFVVFIGTSGCGKTTTLRMMNRLIEPSKGEILIDGKRIKDLDPVDLRRSIGYVIQQIGLFPNMTVEENIQVVPKLLGWDKAKMEARTRELLNMVELPYDQYGKKYPKELSGGQQQRIGVMRALAAEPPIILMDEPFGALDPITRDNLQDEIKRLHKQLKKTIIFVTHDMDEAIKLADVIVFMHNGEIVQQASPEEFLTNPANDFVRDFIGKHGHGINPEITTVSDFMKRNVVKGTKTKGPRESISLMNHKNVNMLVVTDDDGVYEGIVTIDTIRSVGKNEKTIEKMIEDTAITVDETMDAREAFDVLIKNKAEFLIALDQEHKLKGLVTRTSMVKAMADALWGEPS